MRRMLSLSVVVLSIAALGVACSGDKKKPVLDLDADGIEQDGDGTGGDADIAAPETNDQLDDVEPDGVEVSEVKPEVEVDADVPPPPALTFCISTKSDCSSASPLDLTMEDDQYPDTLGLQVDVSVTVENIPVGADVELRVDGAILGTQKVPQAEFSFNKVTLTHKPAPDCHTVEVRVPDYTFEQQVVCVETGQCGLTIAPLNEGCFGDDSNPGKAGIQADFTVTAGGTDCDEAYIAVGPDKTQFPATPAVLDETGSAIIEVTLSPTAQELLCQAVELEVHVVDSKNPEREAMSSYPYVVDTSAPVVTITSPTADTVNLGKDEDANPDNGIQITVEGTVASLGDGGLVEPFLNGEALAPLAPVGGEFSFVVDLPATGLYTIDVTATDCCAKTHTASKAVVAILDNSDLTLTVPLDGAVLLAKDDLVPETTEVYDAQFQVVAPAAQAGETIEVRCQQDKPGSLVKQVGSLTIETVAEDWLYTVDVLLDIAQVGTSATCWAELVDGGPKVSPQVAITIALPPPVLAIETPAEGALIDPNDFVVSGSAANLDGQTVDLSLVGAGVFDWTTVATETGFFSNTPLGSVPDGAYLLQVEATDAFGNLASEQVGSVTQVNVELDSTAPVIAFVSPLDGDTCAPPACADTIAEDVMAGHQIEVAVSVSGEVAPLLSEVCLAVNGIPVKPCVAPADEAGQFIARFYGVTLVTGANVLTAVGTDSLAHESDPAVAGITLDVDAPRVTFIAPPIDVVTATQPVDVVGLVTSPDGTVPLEDATVSLLVGNVVVDTQTAGAGGQYSFQLSGLQAGVTTLFQLSAVHPNHALPGYSDIRKATLKDQAPSVTITSPTDGQVFNKASTQCAAGVQGCQITVQAATTFIEDGQEVTLTLSCSGQADKTYKGKVAGDKVSISKVLLPDKSQCTLVALGTDQAGQQASSAPVTVTIDRTSPKIVKFSTPATAMVPANFDLLPDLELFQFVVAIQVQGVEAGSVVTLKIKPEKGNETTVTAVVEKDVSDTALETVYFAQYAFTPGLNTLTVSIQDEAGNPATLSKQFQFFTDPTEIELYSFEFVDYKTCSTSAECGLGVCAPVQTGKRCVTGWKSATQSVGVLSMPAELFVGTKNLRFCSDHPSVGGDVCAYTGEGTFHVLKLVDHPGFFQTVEFAKAEVDALPQGLHKVFVEAKRSDTGDWVPSALSSSAETQFRYIYVDTLKPTLSNLVFPDDKLPTDGWLSISEAVSGSNFDVQVTVDSARWGTTTLSTNGMNQKVHTNGSDVVEQVLFEMTLFQGANQVCAEAKDVVGNKSDPLCQNANVDTLAPQLKFVQPQNQAKLLVGSSPDASLLTEPGLEVTLNINLNGNTTAQKKKAAANGTALFAGALSADGTYVLTATVGDAAGNSASAATTPASILVDRTPPAIQVIAPATGAALTAADDADGGVAGFQVLMHFKVGDGSGWKIESYRCGDAQYADCEDPGVKVPLDVQDLGNGEYKALISLAKLYNATEYRRLVVSATDPNGNVGTGETKISVAPGNCVVELTSLPENGFVNNSLCTPAGVDCQSVPFNVDVLVSGACGAADQVVLYVDDVPTTASDQIPGTVQFPLQLAHGQLVTLQARLTALGAETGDGSALVPLTVDLTDPVPAFVAPAAGPYTCNAGVDQSAGLDGCQFTAQVQVTGDNLEGGEAELLRRVGANDFSLAATTMTSAVPFTYSFTGATLPETDGQTLVLAALDAAGNAAEVTLGPLVVDVTPPAAVTLNSIDPAKDVDRRRPSVRLTWNAPADNGTEGQAVTAYEFRYSATPILTEQNFDAACDPMDLAGTTPPGAPKQPGAMESFEVAGPDVRAPTDPCRFVTRAAAPSTYYFAVRAIDDVGNMAPFAAKSVTSTSEVVLKYAKFTTVVSGAPSMGSWVFALGDLDGDNMGETAVGGDATYSGFCIVHGSTGLSAGINAVNTANPDVQCIKDTYSSWAGYDVVGIGDVNGDGFRDVGSLVYYSTPPGSVLRTEYRIYLTDPATGFLFETPAVKLFHANYFSALALLKPAGNFNGDQTAGGKPLYDIVLGIPELNKAFIVPGNSAWKSTAPVSIDLSLAANLTTWKVITVTGVGLVASDTFGNAAGVGNVLLDGGGVGTQYDDLIVSRMKNNGVSAFIIPGRSLAAAATLTVSKTLDGTGSEDTKSVRLIPEPTYVNSYWFGAELPGARDLDADGALDVVLAHYSYTAPYDNSQIYVFDGANIQANVGKTIQLNTTAAPGLAGVYVATGKGMRIQGPYSILQFVGNFDHAPTQTGASVDLMYTDFSYSAVFGHIYTRLNQQENASGEVLLPYADITVTDPYAAGNLDFGGWNYAAAGDITGDGLPDVLAASKDAGYDILIY